jgi:cell wall-associated NlpC family hydrolase
MKKQKMVSLVLAGLVMFSGIFAGSINVADAHTVTKSATTSTKSTKKTITKSSTKKTTSSKKASKKTPTRIKRNGASRGGSTTGSDVVDFAKKQLGKPYVWGAAGPKSFDCSGFTMYVFTQFGVSLPHSSISQANYGTTVSKSSLRAGDLVFFKTEGSGKINHVGIYIGNDQFIHGSSGKGEVYISDFSNYTSRQVFVTAKRHF